MKLTTGILLFAAFVGGLRAQTQTYGTVSIVQLGTATDPCVGINGAKYQTFEFPPMGFGTQFECDIAAPWPAVTAQNIKTAGLAQITLTINQPVVNSYTTDWVFQVSGPGIQLLPPIDVQVQTEHGASSYSLTFPCTLQTDDQKCHIVFTSTSRNALASAITIAPPLLTLDPSVELSCISIGIMACNTSAMQSPIVVAPPTAPGPCPNYPAIASNGKDWFLCVQFNVASGGIQQNTPANWMKNGAVWTQ